MSSEMAIKVENLSKCYQIYSQPGDRLKQSLYPRLQRVIGRQPVQYYREFWALHDVTFQVRKGEAIGILGRNGAGKSTLLQIIAGTVTPTSGRVTTDGRITALLELGSGFNPEFTGRENVLLNAHILGLTSEDTEKRFDDIASFADIGDFIEQPVKTYSSGMMMRLAFAVQTAVDPKVLIVDEALSVGDMFFQAKCMARISRLVESGVALLFVSHDISAVRQLCQRAVLLDGGVIRSIGSAAMVSDQYVKLQLEDRNQSARNTRVKTAEPSGVVTRTGLAESRISTEPVSSAACDMAFGQEAFEKRAQFHRVNNGDARVANVQMLRKGEHCVDLDFEDVATIRMFVQFAKDLANLNLSIKIRTLQGVDVVFFDTRLQEEMSRSYKAATSYLFEWEMKLPLLHGNYVLAVGLAHPPLVPGADWIFVDIVPHAYEFRMAPRKNGMIDGLVTLPASLAVKEVSAGLA